MSYQLATALLVAHSQTITVPRPPIMQENLTDDIEDRLNNAVHELDTVHQHMSNLKELFGGHSAFTQAQIDVNAAQTDFQSLLGYITDIEAYAKFWRRLAQKLVSQYEPTRPVIYKPFDEV